MKELSLELFCKVRKFIPDGFEQINEEQGFDALFSISLHC